MDPKAACAKTLSDTELVERTATIRTRLFVNGYTLSQVDRAYKLPRNATSRCLREPYEPAEKAIADILGTPARELFPDRYDETGCRLKPQPRKNYGRVSTLAQRRKKQRIRHVQ